MEAGNGAEENSQQYRDSGGGSVGVNPTGVASITIPLSSSASPSPRLNASPGGMYYLIAEATRFSADIKRLSGELADAKQRIAVQDEEMAQLHDQVHQQGVQLAEAAEIMTEQQNKIAELEEEKQGLEGLDMDAKELKKMLAFERKTRTDAEEKLQKLKESMKAVTGELHEFIVGLGENVQQENYWSASSSTARGRNWDLTPQNKLDRLSEFVENKFDAWAARQRKLKNEVTNVNAVFWKLEKFVKTKRVGMSSIVPPAQRTSSFGRRQQQQQQQRTQVAQRSLGMSVSSVPSQRTNVVRSTMSTYTRPPASVATAAVVVINPPQQSPNASTSQIQIKEEIPPPPKSVPGNEYHAEDTARFKEGFFCICGTDYSSHSNLRIHVRTFTEEGKFKCNVCKQHFLLFYMLRRHLKYKHKISNNKSVGCSVCGKEFKTFTRLYEHRKSAHPKESFKKRNASSGQPGNISTSSSWNTTQQSFYDEGDDDDITFIGAVTAATAVSATATTATTSAQSPPPLTYSNDTDENDEIERPINYFGKRHGLDVAKRQQGFFCICGSKLLNRRKLDIHVRRSNQQDLSGGVINYNDDLYEEEEEEEEVVVDDETEEVEVEEEQADEEEESESDSGYGRTISRTGIHRHQHKHGAHPTNPLECICGYVGTVRGNYTKHLAYYTMERKFTCELCSMRFINTTYLKQHMIRKHKREVSVDEVMKIRTGCSKCGKVFRSMQLFRRHDKIAHGSTVFGRKKRTPNLAARNNGFNPRRRRGPNTQFSRVRTTQVRRRPSTSNTSNNTNRLPQRVQHFPSSRPDRKFGCDRCDASFAVLNQLLRHRKGAHGIVHKGFAIGCRDCGIAFENRVAHSQHRITVHHSAIGRNKKGRLANPVENDPPMPKLKNEERRWVSTSAAAAASSPPLSPQAIPISIDDEDGAASNGDSEQPSSSAAAATVDLYEYDEEDNEDEEDMDESQNDDSQRHAIDSTKIDQGNFCLCGSEFNERKNLLCHIRRHTEKWRFRCNRCKKPFYYNSALKRHMLFTHKVKNIYARNKRVGCVTCGETFKTWFELRQHRKNMHSSRQETSAESQSRPRNSGGRRSRASSSSSMNRSPRQQANRQTANRPQRIVQQQETAEQISHGADDSMAQRGHFCLCGKDFSSEKTLSLHIKYQTRERTVPCPICNKLFICQSYMKQHVERSHKIKMPVAVSTLKAFRCRKCPKTFKANAELLSHTRTAHKTNNQVAAAAGVERATRTARSLAAFRQRRKNAQIPLDSDAVHEPSTEHPSSADGHKCSCGREYFSKGALQKHIRLQVEGKIFQCQLCPREFAEHSSLKVHMRKTHHVDYNNGTHACGICANVFATRRQVVTHRKQVHGKAR